MDDPLQTEKLDPEEPDGEGSASDYATRHIDPSELYEATQAQPESETVTELVAQTEDPAATILVADLPKESPPAPLTAEPVTPPAASAPVTPAAPKNSDPTKMLVIFAVAAVALVCICACTIIAVTALVMIPTL